MLGVIIIHNLRRYRADATGIVTSVKPPTRWQLQLVLMSHHNPFQHGNTAGCCRLRGAKLGSQVGIKVAGLTDILTRSLRRDILDWNL